MNKSQQQIGKKQILILHGWGGSKQSWQQALIFFDKEKYQIFVPDLPGFGDSAEPNKAWTVEDYAEHVKKLMADYNLKEPICIAHSFGGRIAIKLAAQNPEIFSQLFLVAAAGVKHPPSLKIKLFRWISKTGKYLLNLFKLQKLETKARILLYKAAQSGDYLKAEGAMKETFQNVIDEDLTQYLEQIKIKTHIIWGDLDSYVPVADAHVMNERISGSTIDIFRGGKHGLHLQMPEKLVKLIEKYLA